MEAKSKKIHSNNLKLKIMEFIKVTARQCYNDGELINGVNDVTLYLNPDIIKVITEQKSVILKDDEELYSQVMFISNNHYTNFNIVDVVNLSELIG